MPYKDQLKQKQFQSKLYSENKSKYKQRTIDKIKRNAEYIYQIKINSGCSRCKEKHPACLDFHHIDPKTKDRCIGDAARAFGLKRLKEEIDKCILLCSNCHRKEHWIGCSK